ncbi:MAG: alpha/beta fold hydrolase [Caulobacterales bacterium]
MTFKTREGHEIAADRSGDPDAPVVLLLHGGGQTRHSWRRARERLGARGYRAIAIDARGHGDSFWAPDGDYGVEAMARDLRDIADQVGGKPAFVGASMGGVAALALLGGVAAPPASSLVLVDVTPRVNMQGAERISAFMRAAPEGFTSLDEVADAVAVYNPHRQRPVDSSGLMKNLRVRDGRYFWHWDPAFLTSKHRLEPERYQANLERAARCVKAPTLLVRGAQSDLVGPAEYEAFLEVMPKAAFVDVAGAGHMVAGDDNDAFAAAVIAFLETHPPS